ncbi:GGDEF domain-containing protein [Vibrio methylphosphonaticus]|uniref:GGDEF domain-containing protein n=1 Tax=Vibrio methylphosphonaticus TaxID=2946866 RepID=UPI00202A4FEC|nr:sensor domain-containing diguanylate cyclase [Vibrio methylphosphonaticus]MCL9775804.1 diguanylate cyclase [Vibrio methylphosphonaticus]
MDTVRGSKEMDERGTSNLNSAILKLFDITSVPTIITESSGKLHYVNQALLNLLGYTQAEIMSDEVVITHQDDLRLNKIIRSRLDQNPNEPVEIQKRYRHKDGHTIYAVLCIVAHCNDDGVTTQLISQIRDLSGERQSQAGELLLEQLVLKSNDAIYVVDPASGQILNCNELAYQRLGYSKSEMLRLSVSDINPLFNPSVSWSEHVLNMKIERNKYIEATHRRKDGTELPVEASVNMVEHNGCCYLLAVVRDISERKAREVKIIEEQNLDPLTNLPNRRLLDRRLQTLINASESFTQSIAFLYIDVDNFKIINDQYGHTTGDEILVELARRMNDFTRQSDITARLGGDEFLVVMKGIKNQPHARSIAEHLLQVFSHRFKSSEGKEIDVSLSIGLTLCKESKWCTTDAIAIADRAMYLAKKQAGSAIAFLDCQ